MSIIEKIGYYLLRRKVKENKRKLVANNLESANSVGVIFNATNESSFLKARAFAQTLTDRGIKVQCIGYVDNKSQLDFFADIKEMLFFSRKDHNWLGRPKDPKVNAFAEKHFDILIDLSLKESLPVQYIVGLSKAKMKVGKYLEGGYYDMMIDIRKDPSLDNFIKQLGIYLNMFKVNIYAQ